MSWLREDGGYQILCNRDEKRTRAMADDPAVREEDGVRILAPRDRAFGGAWISVNDLGLSLCLLNAPAQRALPGEMKSRGLLLAELSASRRVEEVFEGFSRRDLTCFAPFSLLALEPGLPASLMEWHAEEKRIFPNADAFSPLISSSFDLPRVKERRMREFDRIVRQTRGEALSAHFAFHASHGAQPDAYSPCMHRPDAGTVSFSWIKVNDERAEFFYAPGPVCQWQPGRTYELAFRG